MKKNTGWLILGAMILISIMTYFSDATDKGVIEAILLGALVISYFINRLQETIISIFDDLLEDIADEELDNTENQ